MAGALRRRSRRRRGDVCGGARWLPAEGQAPKKTDAVSREDVGV